jgi:AraC family transcriptional regulator
MNWFELVNKATLYVENHISENIKAEDIAKHCNVSYHYFTKTFSIITGYSLMEYIRNRRITLASYDVSNTDTRILDIALKYGYSSNEAFTRAFKKIHGINPSVARKNNISIYTHFPVLKYDIPIPNIISLRYDIVTDLSFHFVGKSEYIVEDDYEQTQKQQIQLLHDFIEAYPTNQTVYRVHYNLSYNNLRYDYMIACQKEQFHANHDLQELKLDIPKAIRFISNQTQKELIPKIKKVIYEEWEKNDFIATGMCEIEYVLPNQNNTVDFYYIVSIK